MSASPTAAKAGRLYKFLDDLVRIGAKEITASLGVPDDQARQIMQTVANGVCLDYARFHIYVPAAVELQLDPRNEAIWAKYSQAGPTGSRPFSTARITELAQEYELTERQIYSVVSLMRARDLATRQVELPGIEPAR
jgi:Mor family transcriptional regulator